MFPIIRLAAALALIAMLHGCGGGSSSSNVAIEPEPVPTPTTRPFLMGFTPWPSDLTPAGIKLAGDFAHAHGDIISIMLIGGLPWPEAAAGLPYSSDVENTLSYQPPAGKKLFLSISPLNANRDGLAPYWGDKDNQPLPDEWRDATLDSPQVKQAFLAFVLHAVERMHPDYLAIAIEANVLLSKSPAKWTQLKTLYRETYQAVKQRYPLLPVCFTTEVMHYLKFNSEALNSDQEGEVADLLHDSDLFAMSVYPYLSHDVPRPLPGDFFDFAHRSGKPIAVSESGFISRDVYLKAFDLTLFGSENEQAHFVATMLSTAARDNYTFVVQFATTDFEKLSDSLPPPMDDVSRIWAYTGMQTSDGHAKPALAIWDAWLNAPHRPH